MKNKIKILAIETSCDETAAAVVEYDTESMIVRPLSSVVFSQIDIHKNFGGVFPELASRAHSQKILPVVAEALASAQVTSDKLLVTSKSPITNHQSHPRPSAFISASIRDISAIAVTTGPGLIGSLIVGVEFARGLATALDVPVIPVNHLEGHIYACYAGVSTKKQETSSKQFSKFKIQNSKLPAFPLIALVVSGGHTMLVLMRNNLDYEIIGTTLDDAAGEAFDKIARMLGLPYPGGPELSHLAENGDAKAFNFPRSMMDSGDFNFSFSGLKTSVFYKLRSLGLVNEKAEPISPPDSSTPLNLPSDRGEKQSHPRLSASRSAIIRDISASAQQAIVDVLVKKTFAAAAKYKVKSILVGGGVSANSLLRSEFAKLNVRCQMSNVFLSPSQLATDNALSIAIAACYRYQNGNTCSWQDLEANASQNLVNS